MQLAKYRNTTGGHNWGTQHNDDDPSFVNVKDTSCYFYKAAASPNL